MTLTLHADDDGWRLNATFDWYDPPEAAYENFVSVADDVASLLSVQLEQPISTMGPASVVVENGHVCGPQQWHVRLLVAGPDEREWHGVTTYLAEQTIDSLHRELIDRFRHTLDHPRSLLPDVYYCIDRMKQEAGGLDQAAKKHGISVNVLRTIGKLASRRGDSGTARKAPDGPLSEAEATWLRAAFRAMILRVGDDKSSSTLDMGDLPAL